MHLAGFVGFHPVPTAAVVPKAEIVAAPFLKQAWAALQTPDAIHQILPAGLAGLADRILDSDQLSAVFPEGVPLADAATVQDQTLNPDLA